MLEIPTGVKLVAVSKTQQVETIQTLYDLGQRIFGENKVQELVTKQPQLPEDIEWHFIGHLQRNKVKFIVPIASLIHSIDSYRLLREVNKEAARIEILVNCLLQFHIATEETKFGMNWEEAVTMITSPDFSELKNIAICGVMGMATYTDNQKLVRQEFHHLKEVFDRLKESYFRESPEFKEISMGMSSDFRIAIEEGSTLVRVGTLLFGSRQGNVMTTQND